MTRHPWRGGHVAGWLSRQCVRGGEPTAELVVEVGGGGDADTVGEQGVELGRRLQSSGHWRGGRQDQPEVDPAGRAGLDHRELLAAAKAQVALLLGDVEGAKRADLAEKGIMQRPESGFRASVESVGRVRRCGYADVSALPGQQRDAVRRAVREPVISFEHRDDLVVLGQARRVDDREPVVEWLAVGGLDVTDLGLQGSVDVHQLSSVGSGAAPSRTAIWPVICRRTASAGSSARASRYAATASSRRPHPASSAARAMCSWGQRASRELAASVSRIASPAAGPSAYATATARFASITGDGSNRSSSPYNVAICRQSVSEPVAASAWQAAMAACSWYGPGRRWASAVSTSDRPSSRRAWSHRLRSWSASRTSVPSWSARAALRALVSRMSASSPVTSGSSGISRCSPVASRSASSHRSSRTTALVPCGECPSVKVR